MKQFCLGVGMAIGLTLPAFALDGTPSPNATIILPAIKAPPDLQLCGYASCLPQDPTVERAAKELLEHSRQLRRDAADLLAQANPGPTASLKDQLVGAWTLVSCNPNDAAVKLSCGANPNGILINDASGRYAWLVALRGRPKGSESANTMPAEELGTLARGLTANFGTWSVNEVDKTYTIHIDGALFTNAEGMEVKAPVSVSGDELRIGGPNGQNVYRRIKR